jgi:hypothetical protein
MAIDNGKLCDEILASIFVENEVFFSGGSCEQIHVYLLVIFVSQRYFIVISDA